MTGAEYLVSYGKSGDFSRFRSAVPVRFRRGDRVVVRGPDGLAVGEVMCPVTSAHARYLSQTAVGELLRPFSEEDERAAQRLRQREARIFEDARRLAAEMRLPLEILDAELRFDGRQVVLHHVRRQDCDYRPLVRALSDQYDVLPVMQNLALPAASAGEGHGCGKPGCGQANGGRGCDSCGPGGGCSSGGCGKNVRPEELAAYLTGLHGQPTAPARTPLL